MGRERDDGARRHGGMGRWLPTLAAAALLAILLPLPDRAPAVQRETFCRPAAAIAASALGAPFAATPEGFRIEADPQPIMVVADCSGARYFCLLVALLAAVAIRCRRYRALPAVLPIAYLTTLAANSARIVCCWYARRAAGAILPPEELQSVHMAAGAVCFVVFLVVVYSVTERRLSRDEPRIAA